jgi:3-hydroxyacyl-[acyl-carrier-protein] dehydratase
MNFQEIISRLPYESPFLFVDELQEADENGIKGSYTFKNDEYFYQGHFKDNPITPGVILIETMAQIGLVSFGIFLVKDKVDKIPPFAFTSSNVSFYKMVLPGQKVNVVSKKHFFRMGKLKCNVEMLDQDGSVIASGEMSGMMINPVRANTELNAVSKTL